ncbi:MAG: cation transporter [Hyphomonadaceae bacterium]|jgi:Co/Zn/Cd efflux system component
MSDDESFEAVTAEERRTLWIVLGLNLLLVVVMGGAGVWSDSSALIANALDNASDAGVYALSLFAVGRSLNWKRGAAGASGVLLILFGLGVVADTVGRFLTGSEPIGAAMVIVAVFAGAINLVCVWLLGRLKKKEVHLRAAETFSFNDFISNGGVLVAGALVVWLGQRWPDLVVGLLVAAVATKGGLDIILDARRTKDAA